MKLLRTYLATTSGSLEAGRSMPRWSRLKSLVPKVAIMDLMPLWPLKLDLNLLSAAFLLDSDIAELVFKVIVGNDEMIFEDLLD